MSLLVIRLIDRHFGPHSDPFETGHDHHDYPLE
jgi:hypothetical protein